MNPAGKIKSILFVCTLILSIASGAKGGSVVVSADVPTTDIIVSDGEERATFTKIFDVDASDNHGRGNTFTTPNDFVGTGWVMTGLTIRKYNNQTYNNDTLKTTPRGATATLTAICSTAPVSQTSCLTGRPLLSMAPSQIIPTFS